MEGVKEEPWVAMLLETQAIGVKEVEVDMGVVLEEEASPAVVEIGEVVEARRTWPLPEEIAALNHFVGGWAGSPSVWLKKPALKVVKHSYSPDSLDVVIQLICAQIVQKYAHSLLFKLPRLLCNHFVSIAAILRENRTNNQHVSELQGDMRLGARFYSDRRIRYLHHSETKIASESCLSKL